LAKKVFLLSRRKNANFWINLQSTYELDLARHHHGKEIQRIPKRSETAERQLVA
jgi:plasmid maintenance system antidote protein VapI